MRRTIRRFVHFIPNQKGDGVADVGAVPQRHKPHRYRLQSLALFAAVACLELAQVAAAIPQRYELG